jgi:hypothetical protein
MKTSQLKWILGTASVFALAATSFAQVDDGGLYVSGDTNRTSGASEPGKSRQFCRSKDLVGAMVRDPDGKRLGNISEIYLNAQTGETIAAIGLSARQYALVPLQALRVTAPEGTFRNAEVTLKRSKADLESGPIISANEWSRLDDAGFTQTIYSYYGVVPPSAIGGAGSPGSTSSGTSRNQR